MIEVADVLADEGLAFHNESNRILEIRAQSQDGAIRRDCSRGSGGIAPGPAENRWAKNARASNRIVHAAGDGPFADQKTIRNAGKLLKSVIVLVGNWLA